jgi:hypothetical protein
MKSPLLGHCLRQKGYLTDGKRQKVVRYHNQSGILQHSVRHTRINAGLSLSLQGGSKSTPRARITMRPKLAGSCWFDTMMGKSLRKTGTKRERQVKQHKEVCFWLVLSGGFPPAGASSRALDTHGCTLSMPLLVWHSNHTDLGPEEKSLRGRQKCYMLV